MRPLKKKEANVRRTYKQLFLKSTKSPLVLKCQKNFCCLKSPMAMALDELQYDGSYEVMIIN